MQNLLERGTRNILNKRILVSGYYGYNNIGDEAILKGLVDGISQVSDAELVILSKNPDFTQKNIRWTA